MSLRKLPELQARQLPQVCSFAVEDKALNSYQSLAPAASAENDISILDVIGEDFWSDEGVSSKRIAAALRSIGDQPVTVNLNSPGGDFFEGVAIYNMLRQHPAKVTVRILGIAASAASVIAMAGDEIQIGKAGFIMVHNAWVVAIGNRHDMIDAAKTMEPFDAAMATVYANRSGASLKVAEKWMDDETWFNGEEAVTAGLADGYLKGDAPVQAALSPQIKAERRAENALIRTGMHRSERRSLIGELKGGKQDAAPTAMQDAGAIAAALRELQTTITS